MSKDLYKNKYRVSSVRLPNWDYSSAGAYFITICTAHRQHYFGEIENNKMILSNIGVIADVFWHEIKNHDKNVQLDAFVVMPNHIHGILILKNDGDDVTCRDVACNVSTDNTMENTDNTTGNTDNTMENTDNTMGNTDNTTENKFMASISPKSGSVSTIIRSYKSAVTKHAHRLGFEFDWQTRFYDHIIRNEYDFNRIRNYIINNPKKWNEDKFYD